MLVGTAGKEALVQGKNIYVSYRNPDLGVKVHSEALEKVMHGSVNKYFDVTPVGRIIQKFNTEVNIFKMTLMNAF